jgi:hypothetical protein
MVEEEMKQVDVEEIPGEDRQCHGHEQPRQQQDAANDLKAEEQVPYGFACITVINSRASGV